MAAGPSPVAPHNGLGHTTIRIGRIRGQAPMSVAPGHCRRCHFGKRSLRDRRNPAARPCAGEDVRLGDPQGAPRPAGDVDAARGGADLADRRRRGAGLRDGRRRQLQRRLGRRSAADLAARRPQESVPHRRLRRLRHRLGGRRQGEALEGRRRGHRPLQSGRRRRRGLQRRRSDALALAAHLGLRDAGRLVRAVLPRAVAPAHDQAEASHLGGGRPATR